jgi:hypothetical protein
MAITLYQGDTVVTGRTQVRGGRLTVLPDGSGLLDLGGVSSSASGYDLHAASHYLGEADAIEIDGSQVITGSLNIPGGIDAVGIISSDSHLIAGTSVFAGSLGVNFTDLLGGAPLFNIPLGAPVCTNLDTDLLDGQHGSYYRDAGNLNAGNLNPLRMPAPGASWAWDWGVGFTLTTNRTWLHTGPFTHQRNGIACSFGSATASDARLEFLSNAVRVGILNIPSSGTGLNLETDAGVGLRLQASGRSLGFYGVTPVARPSALTQTYSTADRTHAARTAAALTDNTTGTITTTLAALPNPADAPATADALRDDLVANLIPVLRNALATLTDQVNKIRTDQLDTAQFVNSLVDDLQLLGLEQ